MPYIHLKAINKSQTAKSFYDDTKSLHKIFRVQTSKYPRVVGAEGCAGVLALARSIVVLLHKYIFHEGGEKIKGTLCKIFQIVFISTA